MFLPDPVGSKLVHSLARPGGNITGLSNFAPDLIGKRMQFLKETIPKLSHVALLVNPDSQISRSYIDVTQAAAVALGLAMQTFEVRSLNEIEPAFDAMARAGMQAVTINADGLVYQGKAIIAKLAIERRMALSAYSRETFDAGALMSYGPDNIAACHRAAVLVDKILKDAKPSEIPVEQPNQVPVSRQPKNGEGPRPHRADIASLARRRGDRVGAIPLLAQSRRDLVHRTCPLSG